MNMIKSLHLVSGITFLIIFAVTGYYMQYALGLPDSEFTAQRMMYRASHIYILLAGALNTIIGCYWVQFDGKYSKMLQGASSILILFAQPIFLVAFWLEPAAIDSDRVITFVACVFILVGAALSVLAKIMTTSIHRM